MLRDQTQLQIIIRELLRGLTRHSRSKYKSYKAIPTVNLKSIKHIREKYLTTQALKVLLNRDRAALEKIHTFPPVFVLNLHFLFVR